MVKIGFTGDFCPWERVEKEMENGTWEQSFNSIKDFLDSNDFNIIDLECPLTNSEGKISKTGPHIKASPNTVKLLSYLNCKHVVTANNHFKDYDWEGMEETYSTLSKAGVSYIGSGKNINEASKTFILESKGLKIEILNMAEHEWSIATETTHGCNPIDYPKALNQIQNAKGKGVDFVVVVLHGGHEHYPLPSPRMKALYRFMVDAGADAVLGHHTHIISGYEVYKDAPIFYSLGNFCFDYPNLRNSTWNKGLIVRLIFEKSKKVNFEYLFIHQNDEDVGVRLLEECEVQKEEDGIQKLNKIIQDDQALQIKFDQYCASLKEVMLSRIQPYRNRYLVALNRRGLLPDLMNKSKKQMLQILTQCESHREVLLAALK